MKKRTYQRTCVKEINVAQLVDRACLHGRASTTVGLDIAKGEIVACVRWGDGQFERPWSIANPAEIGLLVELLQQVKDASDGLTVGLESTGTYSDAVRKALTDAFLEVHRVSGKSVGDYQEIFDGVPSQHDGKDAAIIAELTAFGKGTPWPYRPDSESLHQMRHWVHRMDAYRLQANRWTGRLEGVLARHWPELTGQLKLNSKTLLRIVLHYGSPAALSRDADAARRLRSWGRGQLKHAKIERIVESARTTSGLPVSGPEQQWLQEIAEQVLESLEQVEQCGSSLRQLADNTAEMQSHVKSVGAVTLCVIWVTVGDPRKYGSSGAFLKALGLNLKELSSGKHQGELRISKRGPGLARKWLYYWALRGIQTSELRGWYREFQQVGRRGVANPSNQHRKMKGLVAMMRKLCRSLWYTMQHELEFDYAKVFPGKPLPPPPRGPSPGRGNKSPRVVQVAASSTARPIA